jgi:hypothetical protein
MSKAVRNVIASVAIAAVMITLTLIFQSGQPAGLYSVVIGAFIGGSLIIVSVNYTMPRRANTEPWLGNERLGWTLIGAGCIMWGISECLWSYYYMKGLNPFPSLADIGFSCFPPLVFIGLILQPSSGIRHGRLLILLDSLISMGALLAIGWFLLLGTLAQTPFLGDLGKSLSVWYPTSDIALLSCVVFLLIRNQGPVYQAKARRVSLIVLGIGLGIFAVSDFNFNIEANAGAYTGQAWIVVGWPYGIMLLGVAGYLRSFLLSTPSEALKQRIQRQTQRSSFGPVQSIPYILLAILFTVLAFNVLSNDPNQRNIRPVLVFATLVVVALVILRQILTQLDNERLTRQQAIVLDRLETANNQIEEQAQKIAERNTVLEEDVAYLKEVHAKLANGNLRARARLTRFTSSDLRPLAQSFNLMADRLIHFEHSEQRLQNLSYALEDAILALEKYRMGKPFVVPPSCTNSPEICRLLLAAGFQQAVANLQNMPQPPGNEKPSTHPISPPPLATRPMDTPLPISPYPVHPNSPSFPTKSRLISLDQNTVTTTDERRLT